MTIDSEDMKYVNDQIECHIEANNTELITSYADYQEHITNDFKKRIEMLEQDLNFLKHNMFDWIKFPSEIQRTQNECT